MSSIVTWLNRVRGQHGHQRPPNLVLGLPLETDDRTIYPVFEDASPGENDGAHPNQIGYIEISGTSADFTPLQASRQLPAVLLGLTLALLMLLLIARRLMSGKR